MKLNVSIDLGHGKKYLHQIIVSDENVICKPDIDKYLKHEFEYMVNSVVDAVVAKIRPEEPAQIFAKSLADCSKWGCNRPI